MKVISVSRYTQNRKQYLPPQGIILLNTQQDKDKEMCHFQMRSHFNSL